MSDDTDSDSKTEEPTDKRLHDAIERGNIPVSRELAFLASLVAYLIFELFLMPSAASSLVATLQRFIDNPSGWRLDRASDALALNYVILVAAARSLGPAVFLFMALGAGASLVQNAPRIVWTRVQPDFSRISLRSGLSRVFGPRGWTEFFKSAIKLGAVAAVVGVILSRQGYVLTSAMFADAGDLPQRLLSLCVNATASVMLAVLVVAGADYAWQRIHWRRDQRMSLQEIKDELKQAEGDRLMKARLRSLRLARSRKRMLLAVPKATMVIVNPTHYAVALRYARSEGGAPTVLAKGLDLIALKIREIAVEHEIPIVEDKPLARSLHDNVAVDDAIPPEFYRAVAEIVHFIQEKRGSWTSGRRRLN